MRLGYALFGFSQSTQIIYSAHLYRMVPLPMFHRIVSDISFCSDWDCSITCRLLTDGFPEGGSIVRLCFWRLPRWHVDEHERGRRYELAAYLRHFSDLCLCWHQHVHHRLLFFLEVHEDGPSSMCFRHCFWRWTQDRWVFICCWQLRCWRRNVHFLLTTCCISISSFRQEVYSAACKSFYLTIVELLPSLIFSIDFAAQHLFFSDSCGLVLLVRLRSKLNDSNITDHVE